LASVNGVLRIGGSTIATVTGLTLDINASLTGDPVVGSNFVPNQFPGRVLVSGQATAYFDSVTLRDAFINETEIDMIAAFTASSDKDSKFMSFVVPRMKLGGASKNDGEGGLIQTIPFTALLNTAGGTGISSEYTTLSMQDSDA
jgi:Phage tail tube protein